MPGASTKYRAALVVVMALMTIAGLAGCDVRVAGTRCRAGAAPAQDARYVLLCQNGRWRRSITKVDAAKFLAAIINNNTPTRVAVGNGTACAVMADATAKCWGFNGAGQLGDGTRVTRSMPREVLTARRVESVALGAAHGCLTKRGQVHPYLPASLQCWGSNLTGQLGDATVIERHAPVAAPAANGATLAFSTPALASSHSCVTSDAGEDNVRCWGDNGFGQLGDGTTTSRSTPQAISGLHASQVVAGDLHTCALLSVGTVSCWGANGFGQLGDVTTTDRSTPTAVPGLVGARSIAAGGSQTCALLGDATVRCWGRNQFGQLGDATTIDRGAPTTVSGLGTAVSIDVGREHACAVRDDARLVCWGSNNWGQLGDGTTVNRATPTLVPGLSAVSAVSGGDYLTCAVVGKGAWCWGLNNVGQLGGGSTDLFHSSPVAVRF